MGLPATSSCVGAPVAGLVYGLDRSAGKDEPSKEYLVSGLRPESHRHTRRSVRLGTKCLKTACAADLVEAHFPADRQSLARCDAKAGPAAPVVLGVPFQSESNCMFVAEHPVVPEVGISHDQARYDTPC